MLIHCEFVYSGDYSTPSPAYYPRSGQCRIGNQILKGSAKRWNPTNIILNLFHPERLPRVWADLLERLDQCPNYRAKEEPQTDSKYDHTKIFSCHAEICRFVERTNWTSLCNLSLYLLLQLLANFTLWGERTTNVVTLVEVIFEESDNEHVGNLG